MRLRFTVIGFAPALYRWLNMRPIAQLHRALGKLERELDRAPDNARLDEYERRIGEIESAVRRMQVPRALEVDLHQLTIHLRMVEARLVAARAAH